MKHIFVIFIDFLKVMLVSVGILTFNPNIEKHIKVFDINIETIRLGIAGFFFMSHIIYLLFTFLMLKDLSKRNWKDDKVKEFWKLLLTGSFYKYHGTIIYYWTIMRKNRGFNISVYAKQIIFKILYYFTIISLLLGLIMLIFYTSGGLILLSIFPISAYLFYLLMLSHFSKTSDFDITKLDYYFAFLPSSNVFGCFAYYRKAMR